NRLAARGRSRQGQGPCKNLCKPRPAVRAWGRKLAPLQFCHAAAGPRAGARAAGERISRVASGVMAKPVVGVIGNSHRVENRFDAQLVGERNLRAIAEVADALPVMFAGTPDITDVGTLLEVVDGVLLTGAR